MAWTAFKIYPLLQQRQAMKIELSNEEIQYLMSLLGEQPTKTGAWLVLQNITQQVQATEGEQNV
jgi:hypothetical protein